MVRIILQNGLLSLAFSRSWQAVLKFLTGSNVVQRAE